MSTGASPLPIRTDRLLLRTYVRADAEPVRGYYSDPEVCRYLLHEPWTQDEAVAQIARRMERTHIDSGAVNLVVEHDGRVIGNVSAWSTDNSPSDHPALVELGWTFSPAVAGRGYATEAVRALIDLVFDSPTVHRVCAQMDARNDASARLATRVEMRQEAHFLQNWWCKGEWTDTRVFALLRSEWHANAEGAQPLR